MQVKTTLETYTEIINRMAVGPAYFTRFGDNDIFQMDGYDDRGRSMVGQTRGNNRTPFSTDLQKEMKEAFEIQAINYMKAVSLAYKKERGMDDCLFQSFPYKENLKKQVKKWTKETEFYNPVTFQYLFVFAPDVIKDFARNQLQGKILFIGSGRLDTVNQFFARECGHVSTPVTGSYGEIKRIWKKTIRDLNKYDVVIPNCGQTSRIITKRLWHEGYSGHVIDMGSIFDCLEGKTTRSWIRSVVKWLPKKYLDDNILSDNIAKP